MYRGQHLLFVAAVLACSVVAPWRHADAAVAPRAVQFPADTAAHAVPVEWWYFVGHLTDGKGHAYGFETTFFKFTGLRRYFPGSPVDTVYRTDVAITDQAAQRFYKDVKYTPMAPGRTIASATHLRLRGATMSVATVGTLRYAVHGWMPDGRVDLEVTSVRAPMLVHGGFLGWGLGYTYYYSLTDMRAVGTLTVHGRRIPVQGTVWHDHQWGDMGGSSVRGWDWMEMQLGDGTDVSLVTERPGNTRWARWTMALLPDNRQQFAPQASMTPLGQWRSPATGVLYPSGWRVRAPSLGLDVVVRPTVRNQEVVDTYAVMGYQASYWEGSCTVTGTRAGHHVSGTGYTELTGYGAPPPAPQL